MLALLSLLIASAALLALGIASRYVIDYGMKAKDAHTINLYFLLFMVAAAIYGLFAALRFYFVTWLGERVWRTCAMRSIGG